jgi:hypothetical protein
MKRIDTASRALNLFGPGKDGFKDGDLANGVSPTDLNANFFNQLQEEVANVVEAAGIALDGTNLQQLLSAIAALTTARFTGANQLLVASGFQKLPGGLIVQWGMTGSVGNGAIAAVNFPIAFPTACRAVVATPITGVSNTNGYSVGVANFASSGFNLTNNSGSSGNVAVTFIALGS